MDYCKPIECQMVDPMKLLPLLLRHLPLNTKRYYFRLFYLVKKSKKKRSLTALKINKIIWHEFLGHQFVNATLRHAIEIPAEYYRDLLFIQFQLGDCGMVNVFHVLHEESNLHESDVIGIRMEIEMSICHD